MNLLSPRLLSTTRSTRQRRAAFTLSEVLIALGILTLGTVTVASLFPTAAFLQKEAVNETIRQNHIRSADSVLEGVGINNTTLLEFLELIETEPATFPAYAVRTNITDPVYDVYALSEVDITINSSYDAGYTAPTSDITGAGAGTPDMRFGMQDFNSSYIYDTNRYAAGNFPEALRSLPTSTPGGLEGGTTEFREREVFWVPLIRAGLEASEIFPDWNAYLFVLQPDSQLRRNNVYQNANYPASFNGLVCANPFDGDYFPKVFRVPVTWIDSQPNNATPSVNLFGFVKPGEKVLGDNGIIYRVAQIDPASGEMILSEQTEYAPLNLRDLGAIWVAPAPGGITESSPLADIRLLSNTIVRTKDF
ncbi:MAG: hypothetical protein AAGA25_09435 [Planctomycetota bacterium]